VPVLNRRAAEWADAGRAILRAECDPKLARAFRAHALAVAAECEAYVEPLAAAPAPRRWLTPTEMAERLGLSVRTLARRRHLPGYRDFVVESEGRGFCGDSERFEEFLRRR
jgi:hypothetical protein